MLRHCSMPLAGKFSSHSFRPLKAVDWLASTPEGTVNDYMKDVVKDTTGLHRILIRYLQESVFQVSLHSTNLQCDDTHFRLFSSCFFELKEGLRRDPRHSLTSVSGLARLSYLPLLASLTALMTPSVIHDAHDDLSYHSMSCQRFWQPLTTDYLRSMARLIYQTKQQKIGENFSPPI